MTDRCAVEGCSDEPCYQLHFSQSWFWSCRYHAALALADSDNGEVSAVFRPSPSPLAEEATP